MQHYRDKTEKIYEWAMIFGPPRQHQKGSYRRQGRGSFTVSGGEEQSLTGGGWGIAVGGER